MPPIYDPNTNVRDGQQRLVSPRINVSMLPTLVVVGTNPVLLPANSRSNRTWIIVQNQGSVAIFLGDISVTITNGYQLNPFSDITIPCNDTSVVYAVASQNNNVSVLEGL